MFDFFGKKKIAPADTGIPVIAVTVEKQKIPQVKKINLPTLPDIPEDLKTFVLQCAGEGNTPTEIIQILCARKKVNVPVEKVETFCSSEDNKHSIERFRELYLARLNDVPIANKRLRLNDLQKVRDKLFNLLNEIDVKTKVGRNEMIVIFRRINETLAVARDEMEGKFVQQNFVNITEFSGLSDDELQYRKDILIAKALGQLDETSSGIRPARKRISTADETEPAEVSLAAPEEL